MVEVGSSPAAKNVKKHSSLSPVVRLEVEGRMLCFLSLSLSAGPASLDNVVIKSS